jgi:hypothetical protein
MKSSLWGWHKTWFYYENHEPSLPSFVGRLPEYQGSWNEEPTPAELPLVVALSNRVNDLKVCNQKGVCVAANRLACGVMPLKKQVHLGWEYSGLQDPTRETTKNIRASQLVKLLEEMF